MSYYSEENIICDCLDVSEHEIVFCVKHRDGKTVKDITKRTGAGSSCGSCLAELEEILVRETEKMKKPKV